MSNIINIALAGNPNSGKSSLFNALTGLNQKVGNFPGVTVDKKSGFANINANLKVNVIDLPGTYSLYPKGADEYVAYEALINPNPEEPLELIIVVVDASNLQRNLLFCSQIMDLKKPVIVALSMMDIAKKNGVQIDIPSLSRAMGVPIVAINPRKAKGIDELKKTIAQTVAIKPMPSSDFVDFKIKAPQLIEDVKQLLGLQSDYAALHLACAEESLSFLPQDKLEQIKTLRQQHNFSKAKVQAEEIMDRYNRIKAIIAQNVLTANPLQKQLFTDKLDKILLHKVWGNIILLLILFIVFQAIFTLSSYPMDWIDAGFSSLGSWVEGMLPQTWWADLIVNGLIAGVGGIVIFVPQIAILFGLITILEDTGYMARISFLSDRLMRSVGLNGRASMPMISGMACAIPAVMAARIIEDKKERLITILITPLMSCSARLPVYSILISLVIPEKYFLGIFGLQGLVLLGLYLLGFVMALVVAKIMSIVLKQKTKSIFLMELPLYRAPRWKNALTTMIEKSKIFVKDAGKVIMVISLVLWGLATYGPPGKMDAVVNKYETIKTQQGGELTDEQDEAFQSEHLSQSYAGILGHAIEPVIRPLGYDWKMGIGLIASFAAREAFVGTMATLYSVGGDVDEDDAPLKEKMAAAKRPDGTPVYTLATGVSMLVFYVFAMQCMSTFAIVKRETKSWKWPLFMTFYMSGLAYIFAFIAYQLLK